MALEAIAVKSPTPEKADQQTLKILEKTYHKMDSTTWLKRKIRRVMRSVTALEEKVDINDHGIESNKVKSVAFYDNLAVGIHIQGAMGLLILPNCQVPNGFFGIPVNFICQNLKNKHLVCLSFLLWQVFLGNKSKYITHIPGLNLEFWCERGVRC